MVRWGIGDPGWGALTVGFSGQLLHNFRLQLAVGFPHARRPRPPLPGPDPLGAPSGSGWVGPGCAEAGRPGWAGPEPRLCLAVPARPVRGAPARCATAADGSRGLGDPARARPWRCRRPRRGVARGWAPQPPGLGSRGRPWLLGCVAHARYRCAAAAPTLPASRPHRRARGGLGAATQRPAPPPAQLRQGASSALRHPLSCWLSGDARGSPHRPLRGSIHHHPTPSPAAWAGRAQKIGREGGQVPARRNSFIPLGCVECWEPGGQRDRLDPRPLRERPDVLAIMGCSGNTFCLALGEVTSKIGLREEWGINLEGVWPRRESSL